MRRRRPNLIESLEARRLMHGDVDLSINFAPKRVPGVEGMIADVGLEYGDRGNGLMFGWQKDNSKNARDRNVTADQSIDTVAFMQVNGGRKRWQIELANGTYDVTVASGDPKYFDSVNVINVEGVNVVKSTPTERYPFAVRTRTVTVTDGALNVRPGTGAENAKIEWIRIVSNHDAPDPDPTPTLPNVSVAATDATATEGTSDHGSIQLTRDGDTSASLTVDLAWTGTAGAGDLSSDRPATATFAAGATTIDLPVVAVSDSVSEPDETVILTVQPSTAYAIAGGASATVTIINVDPTPDPDPEPELHVSNITWATTTGPSSTFSETTSETVGGKMYLFGGFNSTFVPQSKVFSFDGTTWAALPDAPVAFTHVGSAVVGDTIWFAGGYIGNGSGGQIFGTDVVRTYNTATGVWGTGPSLPQKRAAGNLVLVGRKLYYFGGEDYNRVHDTTEMWALDLDNQAVGWVAKAAMPMPRNHASALEINGKIYVLLGQTGYDNGLTAHDDIQIYDPATNAWTVPSQKLPGPRSHTSHSTQFYDGKILIIGGESAHNQPVRDVWSVDPTTLVTTTFNNFPDARFSTATGILNDKLYAIGGYKGSIATQAYVGTFVLT